MVSPQNPLCLPRAPRGRRVAPRFEREHDHLHTVHAGTRLKDKGQLAIVSVSTGSRLSVWFSQRSRPLPHSTMHLVGPLFLVLLCVASATTPAEEVCVIALLLLCSLNFY
jgi:hypothetical protein